MTSRSLSIRVTRARDKHPADATLHHVFVDAKNVLDGSDDRLAAIHDRSIARRRGTIVDGVDDDDDEINSSNSIIGRSN
ncbi:ORF-53 peptide [Chrysodeixis chalcites nucleopolyhedrovirus]|uniref:ORF-53 peptide n=1 Tax=Chrysodeixis chalcites nucleopolyhedrovirus TaxID=320432 RepID=Q4KT27_9ABAC|nr:ORF-53 peptide [Chrysodeixis chalcites nucleopolyhedrovirus]AAY83984.1 ORF-53 peptide [Chrysodeixis chalcites nucleopolyhedrovirus]AGE61613.1 hypothetical protein [Chrysodeixis chalcites nucleopolyhedrovirus]